MENPTIERLHFFYIHVHYADANFIGAWPEEHTANVGVVTNWQQPGVSFNCLVSTKDYYKQLNAAYVKFHVSMSV